MDPLAVYQVKLRELLRALEQRIERDKITNRKASLTRKAKLSRIRARLARSQAGYSREAAIKILAVLLREAAELAIELVIEAFIRSNPSCTCHSLPLAPSFAGCDALAA
jgi:hypothetical protein